MAIVVVALAGYTYYFYQVKPKHAVKAAPTAVESLSGVEPAGRTGELEAYFPRNTFLVLKMDLAAASGLAAENGWGAALATPVLTDYFRRVVGALDPEAQTLVRVLAGYLRKELVLGVMPPPTLNVEATLNVPAVFAARLEPGQSTALLSALRTAYKADFPERADVIRQEGPEMWSVSTAKGKLYCSLPEATGIFFASMDPELLRAAVKRGGGAEGTVLQNSEYAKVRRKFLSRESAPPLLFAFCDAKTMMDSWKASMERKGRVDTLLEKQFYDVRKLIDGLGLSHARGLAYLVHASTDGARSHAYLDLEGKYEGIFEMFASTREMSLSAPGYLPADLESFTGAMLQVGRAWDAIKKAMSQVGGAPYAAFLALQDSFAASTGTTVDDLIYELGNELALAETPGRPRDGLLLLRTKSDRFPRLLEQMAMRFGRSVARRAYSHGPGYVVEGGAAHFPFSRWPAFTYKEPFTYLAGSPERLEAVFTAQAAGNVMAERDDFKTLSGMSSGERHFVRFVSAEGLAARAGAPMGELLTLGLVRGLPVDLSAQRRLLEASLMVGAYEGDGVVVRSFSEQGGELFHHGLVGLGMAPDVLRMRERYQIMLLRERLAGVEAAKARLASMYGLSAGTPVTADGEGRNTYDLLTAGLLSEQPMCPITRQPLLINPIGTPPASPLAPQEGRAAVEALLREHLPAATEETAPAAAALRRKLVEVLQPFVSPGI